MSCFLCNMQHESSLQHWFNIDVNEISAAAIHESEIHWVGTPWGNPSIFDLDLQQLLQMRFKASANALKVSVSM